MSMLSIFIAFTALLLAALALRSSEMVLPRSARSGFNGFPRAWSRLRWSRFRKLLGAVDLLLLLTWWFGLGQRWAWGAPVFLLEGVMLWKLAFLACALTPWMLLIGLADAPRRRLRLAFHRDAWSDLRRFERTAGLLWLFRAAIGLRLAWSMTA
jgi:hypothetical protein